MATVNPDDTSALTPESIRRAALGLPLEDRQSLTCELFESIEKESKDIEQSWAKEIRQRLEDYRNGSVETVSHAEVMRSLDADLAMIQAERKL